MFAQPLAALQASMGREGARNLVSTDDRDVPSGLVDRIRVGDHVEFASQSWREIGGDGQIHYSPAHPTSILPYGQVFSPQTTSTGTGFFTGGKKIQFDIKSFPAIIEHIYLECDLTNTDAVNDTTLAPFITWFDMIALYVNNSRGQGVFNYGGNPRCEYWKYGLERRDEERILLESQTNINDQTYEGFLIPASPAPGSTVTYRHRLPGWWETVPFPFSVIDYLNIDLQTSPDTFVTAGAAVIGTLNPTAWRIVIDPRVVPDIQYKLLEAAWRQGVSIKYMEPIFETASLVSANNATYNVSLTTVQGLITDFNVAIIHATPTGVNKIVTYDDIQTIRLQNESNQDILGNVPCLTSFLRTHQLVENQVFGIMPVTTNKWFYSFFFGVGGSIAWKANMMRIGGFQAFLRNHVLLAYKSVVVGSGTTRTVVFWADRLIHLIFTPVGPNASLKVDINKY